MVFADLTFLYMFLPLNIILYFISKNINYRNIVLVSFSMFFYAWGEPVWIVLLIFSGGIDYIHGLLVEKYRGTIGAKLAVASSLILNLGLLAIFKYSAFFISSVNGGFGTTFNVPNFALPIGISFYTFQTISYVIDVYRNEVKPQKSFLKFMLFVSLYHQLVAGPIVRYSQIANEIDNRTTDVRDISTGITRFIFGLTKKVVVANVAGTLCSKYLNSDLSNLSVGGVWFGVMMFAIQIYYDFSGYSDMAIGLGKIFGFHYGENFCYPYISASATEFWRRWHISLGSFFRDYLYIPLGGNRKHQYLNLFIVWFATGFWHGASWNFIIWGMFWGALVMMEKKFLLGYFAKMPWYISRIYMFFVIIVSWAIFYFTDLSQLVQCLKIMFGFSGQQLWDIGTQITIENNIFWIAIAFFFTMPMLKGFNNVFANELSEKQQKILLWFQPVINIILLIVSTAMLNGQSYNPFLYFRF